MLHTSFARNYRAENKVADYLCKPGGNTNKMTCKNACVRYCASALCLAVGLTATNKLHIDNICSRLGRKACWSDIWLWYHEQSTLYKDVLSQHGKVGWQKWPVRFPPQVENTSLQTRSYGMYGRIFAFMAFKAPLGTRYPICVVNM